MNLAETVKTARRKKDITQEQLAKAVGVHRVTIARIESGGVECSVSTLFRISDVLGVPITELHHRPRTRTRKIA